MASVTPRYLLQGAWYVLEQAGILLRDAVLLRDQHRSPSALGLALFSREEPGKARILLQFIEQGQTGLTFNQVQDEVKKHQLKQIAAIISLMIPVDDRLFMAGMLGDQADDAAQREIDDRADQIMKRLPNQRTRLRERAFYVDPGEDEWVRPVSLSEEQIGRAIWEANYDYGVFAHSSGSSCGQAMYESLV